jgi:hypothetical protein
MNRKAINKLGTLIICMILMLLILFFNNFAQETLVTVFGVVFDTQENPLPGALITVENPETGYSHQTYSQDDGRYIVSGVYPGQYEIRVEMSGFTTEKKGNITLNIGAQIKINFFLQIEKLEEEVTVTAEVPFLEVTKSEISSIVGRKEIENLPLKDRDYLELVKMQPGVQENTSNGQSWASEEIILDGVSNTRNMEKDVRSNIPADAIQEFKVLTNQYSSEYGNASGLQASSITRSGSNDLRGRVSFFYRSDVFDSKNYFARDEDKTELNDLHFGFFLGGPIKKDKTHFFIAYEGRYKKTYQLVTSPLVPHESVPTSTTNNQFFLKINHILSESNFLAFRFTYDEPLTTNYNVGGLHTSEQAADEGLKSYDFQGNWTFVTSNKTLNEFRLLYGNFREEKTVGNPDDYYIIRPSGYLGGYYTAPYFYSEKRLQIVENFSLYLKNHTIKMGFNLNFISTDGEYSIYYPGVYEFNTDDPFNPMDPMTYPFLFVGAQNKQFLDSFIVRNHGIFVQDSWHIFQNLTLNLGLRYNYYDPEGLDINNSTWKSLNPRFGFSWDISGQGSVVIRGGIGTFSNSIFTFYAARVAQSQAANLRIILMPGYPNPNLPNPFSPFLPFPTTELPPQEYVAQEGQIPPYTMQMTLGAEGRISRDFVLSADVVWSKGYNLLRDNNLNPGIPGGDGLLRPDKTKGDVFVYEDSGESKYLGLQIGLRKRYSNRWSGEISYTLSESETNVASDWLGNEEQMSWNNPDKDWGPHRYDARHRFNLIGMFDLPFDFRFSAIVRYHSAYPYNVILGYDANKDGQNLDYPEGVNRFSGRGEDFLIVDTRLTKDIQIKQFNFQLFIDIFNLTDRTNFVAYAYIGNMQSANFGEPTEAWNPRLIQLGLRVDF